MAAAEGDVRQGCMSCVQVYVFVNYQQCLQSTKRPAATAASQMALLRGKTFLVSSSLVAFRQRITVDLK